jgi:hypothetical protein
MNPITTATSRLEPYCIRPIISVVKIPAETLMDFLGMTGAGTTTGTAAGTAAGTGLL